MGFLPEVKVWNLLHDGSIESIVNHPDGTVILEVSIDYLTELMQPPQQSLFITLHNCTSVQYLQSNDGEYEESNLTQAIGSGILEANDASSLVTIWLDDGKLITSYSKITLNLADGSTLPIEYLEQIATSYWNTLN